ncbi:hypothetical protein SAMD00019534_089670 [Acytostelium subglobosum LB1]|uniref:hypothetical protein n=1 Tax=Acytostelium subglobosum LB1 TaxID=1410327 RepID=UPI0006451F6D|nr:hypothetical protein SAMD00019534_089670 [Acytostelium subglobosum LB1]GAM25792.1 hypothetical protein SAMD00019534_089670 [Acytostelium subglobosum LB1]|eukprot:XP_012751310.1 hypothetical protein SAMD00019534_089670 [Acytostelium subglobosum LB1]
MNNEDSDDYIEDVAAVDVDQDDGVDVESRYNDILSVLATETNVQQIERIECPSPLEFYREYVAQNKPVIIKNAFNNWKALKLWSIEYLRNKMKDTEVTVAVTPDGLGDAIKRSTKDGKEYFVKPLEKKIPFSQYLDTLEHLPRDDGTSNVHYLQYQNGSFNLEFEALWQDIDHAAINFAKEAFGMEPEAVNFWMGEDRAISSLHKDPYENIYCVVKGTKVFTLLPPTDYPFLYETEFPAATYVEAADNPARLEMRTDDPPERVPWIPVDPAKDYSVNCHRYPQVERAHPLHVEVHEGEILYLPSLYYHRVAQRGDHEHKTIAINYWFDMRYGPNHVYYQFIRQFNAAKPLPSVDVAASSKSSKSVETGSQE